MNVLVACEESQEVCKAFRAKGRKAYSCDIQEPSGLPREERARLRSKTFPGIARAMVELWG